MPILVVYFDCSIIIIHPPSNLPVDFIRCETGHRYPLPTGTPNSWPPRAELTARLIRSRSAKKPRDGASVSPEWPRRLKQPSLAICGVSPWIELHPGRNSCVLKVVKWKDPVHLGTSGMLRMASRAREVNKTRPLHLTENSVDDVPSGSLEQSN